MLTRTMATPVAELIKGQPAPEKTAPTDSASQQADFPQVNHFCTDSPQITTGENRFTVACRACGQRWTEVVPAGARPGDCHRCRSYQGDPAFEYAATITSRLIVHKPAAKLHKCTPTRCRSARGNVCGCECMGAYHGAYYLRERQTPEQERAELDRLYDRLEQPAWVPPSRRS